MEGGFVYSLTLLMNISPYDPHYRDSLRFPRTLRPTWTDNGEIFRATMLITHMLQTATFLSKRPGEISIHAESFCKCTRMSVPAVSPNLFAETTYFQFQDALTRATLSVLTQQFGSLGDTTRPGGGLASCMSQKGEGGFSYRCYGMVLCIDVINIVLYRFENGIKYLAAAYPMERDRD